MVNVITLTLEDDQVARIVILTITILMMNDFTWH